jgi:hypothetical protein
VAAARTCIRYCSRLFIATGRVPGPDGAEIIIIIIVVVVSGRWRKSSVMHCSAPVLDRLSDALDLHVLICLIAAGWLTCQSVTIVALRLAPGPTPAAHRLAHSILPPLGSGRLVLRGRQH